MSPITNCIWFTAIKNVLFLNLLVSDDTHERISKKDLLIGKRKDKKDSKKDRGYATLEGESSPEEDSTAADVRYV